MTNFLRAMMAMVVFGAAIAASAADYKPGEVIVKYKNGITRARSDMNLLYEDLGVMKVKRSGLPRGYEHLILGDKVKVEDAIADLRRNEMVEYVQPNYILRTFPIHEMENEPANSNFFFSQGGGDIPGCSLLGCGLMAAPTDRPELKPAPAEVNPPVVDPSLSMTYGLTKIQAVAAWKEWRGDKKFIVADIDTGIDYNHEDLAGNLWRNPNPSDANDIVGFDYVHNDGLPWDDNDHGTHTAGTIGAVGGNGVGVSGVIQKVSVMTLKFLSGQGEGSTADAIKAIDYAIEHGARVISASWGGPGDDGNQALYDAIERAKDKGVLFVAAAGNESKNNDIPSQASYPAAFTNDNMIAVAATGKSDTMAYFSNYGAKTTHLAAPGVGIYSTVPGDRYESLSGTSMACPHVSGAVALLWSKHPEWDYKKVKQVLLGSVDKVPSLSGKTITGGRLNILKALHSTD